MISKTGSNVAAGTVENANLSNWLLLIIVATGTMEKITLKIHSRSIAAV